MSKAIDVIIACHTPERPIGRAVRSVLHGNGEVARPIVVCHNTEIEGIRRAVDDEDRDQTIFISLRDGLYSPAGPFMHGINSATAEWVAIMGSDDTFQPGALAAMLRLSGGVDAVIARTERQGHTVMTPPVRMFPRRRRDVVKDRLLYRSAPLGLLRRQFLRDQGIYFGEGLTTGEDLIFSLQLWLHGRIAVQRSGPGYVIQEDATDRVTMRLPEAEEEFRHCASVWHTAPEYPLAVRRSLALKYIRVHFFSYAYYCSVNADWSGNTEALREWIEVILAAAPGCERLLSRADWRLLELLRKPDASIDELNQAVRARRRFGHPETLLPQRLRFLFHREAPFRFTFSSFLTRLCGDSGAILRRRN